MTGSNALRRDHGRRRGRVRAALAGAVACSLGGTMLATLTMGSTAAAARTARAAKPTTLTVASLAAGDWSVVRLAMAKGYFKQHGIALKFVPMNSLPQEIPLMVSGHLDVGYGGDIAALEAVSHGLKLQIIGALERDVKRPQGSADEVVVKRSSGITSLKQLTGKTVAVNALGTPFEYWTMAAIDKAGGNSAKVHFIAIPFTAQAHALASGQVDAIATGQPFASTAVANGGRSLGDPFMLETGLKTPVFTYWLSTPSFVASHRAALAGYMAAMREAYHFANHHSAIARHYISEVTKLPPSTVKKSLPLPLWTGAVVAKTIQKDDTMLVRYHVIKKPVKVGSVIANLSHK